MKESDIQRLILDWLAAKGFYAWRNFVGGIPQQGGKFYTVNPARGMPDIMGLLKDGSGRLFAIEVKTAKGALAVHQKERLAALEKNGAIAFVARDLRTVEEKLVGLNKLA